LTCIPFGQPKEKELRILDHSATFGYSVELSDQLRERPPVSLSVRVVLNHAVRGSRLSLQRHLGDGAPMVSYITEGAMKGSGSI
jgi:hypothetical protein